MEIISFNLCKFDNIKSFLQFIDSPDNPCTTVSDETINALKEITEMKESIILVSTDKMYDSESLIECLNYIKENKDLAVFRLTPQYASASKIKIKFSKSILSLSEFIEYLEVVISDPMEKDTSVVIEHQPSIFDPGPFIYIIWFIENNRDSDKYYYDINDISVPKYFTGILGEESKYFGSSSLYTLEDYKKGFAECLKVEDLDKLIKEKMLEYFDYCISKLS